MTNGAKNGYVSVGTFENKLWKIKEDMDKVVKERKTECTLENTRLYNETTDMKKNIINNNQCISELRNDVTQVKNDVDWLKRFFWIVAASSVGALITGVINLVVK